MTQEPGGKQTRALDWEACLPEIGSQDIPGTSGRSHKSSELAIKEPVSLWRNQFLHTALIWSEARSRESSGRGHLESLRSFFKWYLQDWTPPPGWSYRRLYLEKALIYCLLFEKLAIYATQIFIKINLPWEKIIIPLVQLGEMNFIAIIFSDNLSSHIFYCMDGLNLTAFKKLKWLSTILNTQYISFSYN